MYALYGTFGRDSTCSLGVVHPYITIATAMCLQPSRDGLGGQPRLLSSRGVCIHKRIRRLIDFANAEYGQREVETNPRAPRAVVGYRCKTTMTVTPATAHAAIVSCLGQRGVQEEATALAGFRVLALPFLGLVCLLLWLCCASVWGLTCPLEGASKGLRSKLCSKIK